MERINASLSIFFATRGSNSEIWMPGTLVEIGLKLLSPGLGSQVSTWLGPPSSQSRMQDCALADFSAWLPSAARTRLWSCRNWLSPIPARFKAPTRRKFLLEKSSKAHSEHGMTFAPLMIFRELARGNQFPREVLDSFAARGPLRDQTFQLGLLLLWGETAEGRHIQIFDNRIV